ncbi:ABC transporter permease [Chitiniphilus purpureus]|uniref:ABC transporter permease n=1 Tax=Chitiniphilus purpureus TaxID=2981137 RepID=A0ABY6DUD4_9NEIS|nr:ABC transporter permease [Chitiniphilus sp. CD1]UXY17111.1 ABC transporter permease [Chitiniphilus sp. CD1]
MTEAATLEVDAGTSPPRLILGGRLDAAGCAVVWPQARTMLQHGATVDADAVTYCDGTGAALLFDLIQRGGKVRGLPEQFAPLLAELEPDKPLTIPQRPPPSGLVATLGRLTAGFLAEAYAALAFIGEAGAALAKALRRPRELRLGEMLRVATSAGADALPIVALIAFLLGVILSFQSAIPMRQFGAELFVANLVGLSLVRELAPLMTAVLLAGRTGAAFAAEIGTMKVNQEIDALVTLGLDPMRFLVLPRLLAVALAMPLLTLFAELIGMLGAALVLTGFGIPMATSATQIMGFVDMSDFLTGLFKSFVFGIGIAAIGCMRGLSTGSGARAVGAAATSADVRAIVMLVVADGLFAVAFFYLDW